MVGHHQVQCGPVGRIDGHSGAWIGEIGGATRGDPEGAARAGVTNGAALLDHYRSQTFHPMGRPVTGSTGTVGRSSLD